MKVAVIGAGWAGMAAAIAHTQAGHQITVFEAARTVGGRARAVPGTLPDGSPVTLDNGQHILIGAYATSLRLMRLVGVDTDSALLRLPLTLQFPDGQGLQLPDLPPPLDAPRVLTTHAVAVSRAPEYSDRRRDRPYSPSTVVRSPHLPEETVTVRSTTAAERLVAASY